MDKPIRVAHIIDVMDNGGIEAVVMNYYRNIDKEKVQFDFITSDVSSLPQKEEIERLGGKIYITPRFTKIFKYNKALKKIFKENNYDIVHCHMGTLALFPLRIAKKCKVKIRIAHSHSTSNKKEWKRNLIKNILRPFSKIYATHYFACGELSGEYLFGKKTHQKGKIYILDNSIDIETFKYDEEIRKKTRKKLELEKKFVVGHIGRFVSQKNHLYLIDVFKEIHEAKKDSVLLLVGEGPLEEEVKERVAFYNLEDKVIFFGSTKNTANLYNAMDCFLLPSLYEGLPVVGLEAQVNGLNCIFSDKVTKEIKINNNVMFLPIDDESKKQWKNNVIENMIENREIGKCAFYGSKYDITKSSKNLVELYYLFLEKGRRSNCND